MAEQLKAWLQKVAICDDWYKKMIDKVNEWEREENDSSKSFVQNLTNEIKSMEQRFDKLINAFLDNLIDKKTYLEKKDELIKKRMGLWQKKRDFARKGNVWLEPLRNWIKN